MPGEEFRRAVHGMKRPAYLPSGVMPRNRACGVRRSDRWWRGIDHSP
ncbi:hypothetical protein D187_003501 [Cystobacter fuscus DSM 2262]|uniref:Uncharacterized protein n=1 Tax=Cystobacter fuscus (strain ATCC 25194 / DSM 2262 / NBRC 100088 / M29) TaxID=1242864 RepID=S9P6I2_CYSF2|nr:hypothetical protein D187_003501 [Cystobacter fuscus DSM 2262]